MQKYNDENRQANRYSKVLRLDGITASVVSGNEEELFKVS